MMTRRDLLQCLGGALTVSASPGLRAANHRAWNKPIGLETYTLRTLFAKDPVGTLKKAAAIGYKEIEFNPVLAPAVMDSYVRGAGLTAISAYVDPPKSLDDWRKTVDKTKQYEVAYIAIGDNPRIDADAWRRRADFYNQCGKAAKDAGLAFCYHAHYNEYARVGDTSGYDILLSQCEPKLLSMEMDVFWATYAGVDPIHYWKLYPGRFPLLHIKDLYKKVAVNPRADPAPNGPNPFAPVGKGTIDWVRIFSHVGVAGTQHIFVEQDTCNMPPMEAIQTSFDYLNNLHLG